MKRLIALLLVIFTILSFTACDVIEEVLGSISGEFGQDTPDTGDENTQEDKNDPNDKTEPEDGKDEPSDKNDPSEDGKDEPSDKNDPSEDDPKEDVTPETKTYTAFTASEKALFTRYIGTEIPFIPNDEYYVEGYYDTADYENGINFYTIGNTEAEFLDYLELFSDYELYETYEDSYGDTWYCLVKDDVVVDISYYFYEGKQYVDVFVYSDLSLGEGGDDDSGDSGDSGDSSHYYTAFTSSETALFKSYFGFTIPFVANNEYYLEEYTLDYDGVTEVGLNFYTYGNTRSEFNAYRELLSDYELSDTYQDDYGDTWYSYDITATVMLDVSYYELEDGEYVIDVYVYYYEDAEGGNSGGVDDENEYDVITNAGASLPSDADGVFDVDFTDADYVKDVTDLEYYVGGCPTTGSPAVLVIPVEFSDSLASTKGYTTSALVNAFSEGGKTDYYSVYDYYYISSYGQLTLDVTVLDYWFKPEHSSSYYYNATYDYYGESLAIGDQLVLDEALAYLSTVMDLSAFDSDNNGMIDAVVLVNTLDVRDEDFYWAYRYWNVYTDDYGYYYEYDGVSANDYVWASYQFLHESTDDNGEIIYDKSVMNTYTFIHEFAHVLGVDDYYDTEYVSDPMNGLDIMSSMIGDHNAYTKFNLGWITSSRLVVTNSTVTLTLEAFVNSGDTIIIANNWDESLGAYQEYYVLVYYTGEGLNAGDGGYFIRDGIVVYHVNASLCRETFDGEAYYNIYNNNTDPSSKYGTEDNLIEYVKSANDTYTFAQGDTLPTVTDDLGDVLGYTFTVVEIDGDYATVTFRAV